MIVEDKNISTEKIFLYKNLRNSLENMNNYINILSEEHNHIKDLFKCSNFSNSDFNINDNSDFIEYLNLKKGNNLNIITTIDNFLISNCDHDIIEDYVETGVEKDMCKIKYCNICEMNIE